jgi:hypothetical protein
VTTPDSPGGKPIPALVLPLQGDASGGIADLLSLAGDVEYARWCAQTYLQWMGLDGPQGPDAENLRRAVWTAACITYRRVFQNGKGRLNPQKPRPKPNDKFTAALTPEQLEAHNSMLETATRHVAHRVNELELVEISAVLNPPPLPRGVADIGTMVVHYCGPKDAEEVERFISVCDVLLAGTHQDLAYLSQQLLTSLRNDNLDQMYANARKPPQQS